MISNKLFVNSMCSVAKTNNRMYAAFFFSLIFLRKSLIQILDDSESESTNTIVDTMYLYVATSSEHSRVSFIK